LFSSTAGASSVAASTTSSVASSATSSVTSAAFKASACAAIRFAFASCSALNAFAFASASDLDKPDFFASTLPAFSSNQAANLASACSWVKAPLRTPPSKWCFNKAPV